MEPDALFRPKVKRSTARRATLAAAEMCAEDTRLRLMGSCSLRTPLSREATHRAAAISICISTWSMQPSTSGPQGRSGRSAVTRPHLGLLNSQ